MMENKLRELLDKIYELEGLVHLSIKRDEASRDFIRLISKKGKEVAELCVEVGKEGSQFNGKESADLKEPINSPLHPVSLEEYYIDEDNDSPQSQETSSGSNILELTDPSIDTTERSEPKKGKLVFSINDRFRFKRELFDNSDVAFNNTLALVASMENYDEAEDYFLNEEGLDRRSPAVADFLDVIKRYFQ